MCMGIPMQVLSTSPGHARVSGRGEVKQVNTQLLGPVQPGDWLLVFIDGARERLSPERAAEVNATLDLVAETLAGLTPDAHADPGFALPSAMTVAQLAALTGGQ